MIQRVRSSFKLIWNGLTFGELLDTARRFAELGGNSLRVGDHRQNIAVLAGDLQPPAADQRLIAGGLNISDRHLEPERPARLQYAHRLAGHDQFAVAERAVWAEVGLKPNQLFFVLACLLPHGGHCFDCRHEFSLLHCHLLRCHLAEMA